MGIGAVLDHWYMCCCCRQQSCRFGGLRAALHPAPIVHCSPSAPAPSLRFPRRRCGQNVVSLFADIKTQPADEYEHTRKGYRRQHQHKEGRRDAMSLDIRSEGSGSFALFSVHSTRKYAPALAIAKPQQTDQASSAPATFSSVHFRQHLPSIQYFVQGTRLILTLLGADHLSTVIECGSNIKNVGLHDDSSNLVVHLFLDSHVLYSMIFTAESLGNPLMKKSEGWITEYSAPSFQIRTPLYMHSISAASIIFSLTDGGLLRLSNNGRGYNEHLFSDSSYFSSFKSILPWSGRPSNLVISMQACPEKDLLFTLSVDAKMKVWDIRKGSLLAVKDITDQPLSFLLEAIPSHFITMHSQKSGFHIVTYCPGAPGTFKVFRSRANGVEEVFTVRGILPTTGLWLVFDITIGRVGSDGSMQLHVLWKLDNLSLLQTAIVRPAQKRASWSFATDTTAISLPPESNSEILADFIFCPGRFSSATIQKALNSNSQIEDLTLAQLRRLTSELISNNIELKRDIETGNELKEQYDEDVRQMYYKLACMCVDLDRNAGEPHSLVSSPYSEDVAISQTAKLSLVRPASNLETLLQSSKDSAAGGHSSFQVLKASFILRDNMTSEFWHSLSQSLREEVLKQRTLSSDDTMFVMYEKSVENQIPRNALLLLQELDLSPSSFIDGLESLLPEFHVTLHGSCTGLVGLSGYVALQNGKVTTAIDSLVTLIAFLLHHACSSEEVDIFKTSAIFVNCLDIYKQMILIQDSMKLSLKNGIAAVPDNDAMIENDKLPQSDGIDVVVFQGLAMSVGGEVPTREFLERTLVFLVNGEESDLAIHFSNFVSYQPFASYLQARSLLLDKQYGEAAASFARNGYPFISNPKSKIEKHLKNKLTTFNLVEYNLHVASLFAALGKHAESLRFCTDAELAASSGSSEHKQEVKQRLFSAAMSAQNWDEAYRCLITTNEALKKENIRNFLTGICESSNASKLAKYPFTGFLDLIDSTLESKAQNMLDVRAKPSWHKILYAFRVQHCDFRGAASIMYLRLQFLKNRSHITGFNVTDHLDITEGYLLIINALTCISENNAWIIVGTIDHTPQPKRIKITHEESAQIKRKVLQLKEIRGEYVKELSNMDAQLQQLAGLAY